MIYILLSHLKFLNNIPPYTPYDLVYTNTCNKQNQLKISGQSFLIGLLTSINHNLEARFIRNQNFRITKMWFSRDSRFPTPKMVYEFCTSFQGSLGYWILESIHYFQGHPHPIHIVPFPPFHAMHHIFISLSPLFRTDIALFSFLFS